MKLGLELGYSGAEMKLWIDSVIEAERLGFDSVWVAEAYGSDAITPLAYIAARTERIKLATGIMQIPGRTPAMAAMTLQTLDAISGGRAIAGLGLSGPQVVEGWHGVPYGKPAARIREYVQILRAIWAREAPVSFEGEEYQLPYRGPGATGLGKLLKSILHGRQIPIVLASLGPINLRTAGELADGWLPLFFSPKHIDRFRPHIEAGFERAGGGKSWKDFEIISGADIIITDDVKAGFDQVRPELALYVGGMGARTKNFYNELVASYGYGEAAAKIQDLYLAGRKQEAAAAVPDDLVDEVSLIGPEARIRERLKGWEDAGVTTLLIPPQRRREMEFMAALYAGRGGVPR